MISKGIKMKIIIIIIVTTNKRLHVIRISEKYEYSTNNISKSTRFHVAILQNSLVLTPLNML